MRTSSLFHIAVLLSICLLIAGCSKKQESAGAVSTAAEPAMRTSSTPTQAVMTTEVNAQLQDLQLQVDAYQKIYKRKPASLQQMVQEGFLPKLPLAPPGKKFVYDPSSAHVSLSP